MQFIRIKDREGYSDPRWKKGYVFTSNDYNMSSALGETYVKEFSDRGMNLIHNADSVMVYEPSRYENNSTLNIKLRTDSGYCSDEKHRINIDQWTRICEILNEV